MNTEQFPQRRQPRSRLIPHLLLVTGIVAGHLPVEAQVPPATSTPEELLELFEVMAELEGEDLSELLGHRFVPIVDSIVNERMTGQPGPVELLRVFFVLADYNGVPFSAVLDLHRVIIERSREEADAIIERARAEASARAEYTGLVEDFNAISEIHARGQLLRAECGGPPPLPDLIFFTVAEIIKDAGSEPGGENLRRGARYRVDDLTLVVNEHARVAQAICQGRVRESQTLGRAQEIATLLESGLAQLQHWVEQGQQGRCDDVAGAIVESRPEHVGSYYDLAVEVLLINIARKMHRSEVIEPCEAALIGYLLASRQRGAGDHGPRHVANRDAEHRRDQPDPGETANRLVRVLVADPQKGAREAMEGILIDSLDGVTGQVLRKLADHSLGLQLARARADPKIAMYRSPPAHIQARKRIPF